MCSYNSVNKGWTSVNYNTLGKMVQVFKKLMLADFCVKNSKSLTVGTYLLKCSVWKLCC